MEGSVPEADIAPDRSDATPSLGRRCQPLTLSPQAGALRPDTGLRCKSDGREGRRFVRAICPQVPKAARDFRN